MSKKRCYICLLFLKSSSIFIGFHVESFRGIGDYCKNFNAGMKDGQKSLYPKTNKSFAKNPTLLSKYLKDLSRQGRQKGVRICLLFHKASSIFIGFHAGVNIESKTFFCLTDRHSLAMLYAQDIYFFFGCTVVQ